MVTKKQGPSVKKCSSPALRKPSRPMTSYNLFYRDERAKLLAAHYRSGSTVKPDFKDLAQLISVKWRRATPATKASYSSRAFEEKQKYAQKLIQWHNEKVKIAEGNAPPEPCDVFLKFHDIEDNHQEEGVFDDTPLDAGLVLLPKTSQGTHLGCIGGPHRANANQTVNLTPDTLLGLEKPHGHLRDHSQAQDYSVTMGDRDLATHRVSPFTVTTTMNPLTHSHHQDEWSRREEQRLAWVAQELGSDGIRFLQRTLF